LSKSDIVTAKTLLVNCYLNRREVTGLQKTIEKFSQCTVVLYENLGVCCPVGDELDAVVLSGSEARIVKEVDRAKYTHVLESIKTCKVPLLGICFGHQLLCSAFGAKTRSLDKPVVNRFEHVHVINADGIFSSLKTDHTIPLAEYHNDYVLKDGLETAGFTLLADSASCEVEAVKHVSKPFYGVQFHPERIVIKEETHPEGHRVIENFYRTVVR
jgi:GMP synthase-like glutamine amidotransferase